jgi:peroxiredoxin
MRMAQINIKSSIGVLCIALYSTGMLSANPLNAPMNRPVPAPSFHLEDQGSHVHQLSDFRGKVVIVNFWASWCAPCREELPSMNRARTVLKQKDVAMLAINLGEDREAVNAFIDDFPIDFTVLLDHDGSVGQGWQVTGMPTTFVVNSRGEIVYRIVGKREWDSVEILELIRKLIIERSSAR